MAGFALSSSAMAAYVPPVGQTVLKLSDATGFARPTGENGSLEFVPRGTTPAVGDQDFTAFRITSINENNTGEVTDESLAGGNSLVGVVTFLEYESTFVPFNPQDIGAGGTAQLGDSSRTHTLATDAGGRPTLGRFFLFEVSPGGNDVFDTVGGRPEDVQFDQFAYGHNIDLLPNFTGTGDATLLATGSLVDNDGTPDGLITQTFTPHPDPLVEFFSHLSGAVAIDAGLWKDAGVDEANFELNLYTIAEGQAFPDDRAVPVREDVFNGGWLASSEDPITVIRDAGDTDTTGEDTGVIPEPVTAGLSFLAIGALGGYLTNRRHA
jgi:hypothetical protein